MVYNIVKFQPQNFGGYTFALLVSGAFNGIGIKFLIDFELLGAGIHALLGFLCFLWGMKFYSKDNYGD